MIKSSDSDHSIPVGFFETDENEIELMTQLLGVCGLRKDPQKTAEKLLDRYGTIRNTLTKEPDDLINCGIVSNNIALKLLFLGAAYNHIRCERTAEALKSGDKRDLIRHIVTVCSKDTVEVVRIFCFDKNGEYKGFHILNEGGADFSAVDLKKLTKILTNNKYKSFYLAHNHPYADCIPSADDLRITRNIDMLLQDLNVEMTDHIIVGARRAASYRKYVADSYDEESFVITDGYPWEDVIDNLG